MSDAQTAEVLADEIGSELIEVTTVDPTTLTPHPKNREIYGDTVDLEQIDKTFRDSIKEKGVLETLVVTEDDTIISGHRRWKAACGAGLDSVPVSRERFESELKEREALIEHNRSREKTDGHIAAEFAEMLAIEKERAKERKAEAGTENLPTTDISRGNVSTSKPEGKAREQAAEKIDADVSGRTLEKGKKVKDKAESDDNPEEVKQAARDAWNDLRAGRESYTGAYSRVKDAEKRVESDGEDDPGNDIEQFTSQQTDEWSSPREIVEPLADAAGGFDLDPCSGAESSPFADSVYTEADDGLKQDWFGTVWVNPPYSEMGEWTPKAVSESRSDDVDRVFYLCKGDSSTDWWQEAAEAATVITTVDRRLKFGDGDNSAPFASHILVFGDVSDAVISELQTNGLVLRTVSGGGSDE